MPDWTPAQHSAIQAEGGTVLVSAAAGSGKTAVLVERVIRIILDENNPTDVDQMLIVTFTNAAAAEMRERIGKALAAQIFLHPDNQRLYQQQMLLSSAKICTIDAFCKDLVQQNFHLFSIPQDFRILDESEKRLLEGETATAVLEALYDEGEPAFFSLVELLSSAKNDSGLHNAILKLHDYIMAHPFPSLWLDQMSDMYQSPKPLEETVWANVITQHTKNVLNHITAQLQSCRQVILEDSVLAEKLAPVLTDDILLFETLSAHTAEWDLIHDQLQGFAMSRFPSIRGYADNPIKNYVASVRKEAKKSIDTLSSFYCATTRDHLEDMQRLAPSVAMLAQAVKRFQTMLWQKKQELGALSFADIAQLALHLLIEEGDGGPHRTPFASEQQTKYRAILIDEYQDTNKAQDMLFDALSDGTNLFMVGDVKQSIYRFRQAMPQIFMEKKETFSHYDGHAFPAQIILDQNFRSHAAICAFINFISSLLFSKEVGELEYNQDEQLNPGASFPASPVAPVSLHVLKADGLSAKDADKYEAEYLANMIKAKISSGEVITGKNGVPRPISYGDIAILFRSASAHIPNYVQVFKEHGIPVSSEAAVDFFSAPENATILSLLRVVDNPMQDIPLLSVMLSPLYGFTPDELAQLRIAQRTGAFYTCVMNGMHTSDCKTAGFLDAIARFRTYSVTMPVGAFIRKIYDETAYPAIASSMGEAAQRTANLNLLIEYAENFELTGSKGLSAFIRYIDRIRESGNKLSAANTQSRGAKAVKMMSIHRSKGLEFPVCILAGNSRKYNTSNTRENLLLHPQYGAGLKVHDETLLYQYASVPYQAVRLAIQNAEMSENLRVLYVAMTRAKEQLICVCTEPALEKKLAKLAPAVSSGNISSYVVGSAACDSDLLLCCGLLHKDGAALRALAGVAIPGREATFAADIQVIIPAAQEPTGNEQPTASSSDPNLVAAIEDKLRYEYPYTAFASIAGKCNASQLDIQKNPSSAFVASRPAFLSDTGLTPAQRGTAMHLFMQHCDYELARSNLAAEADRMEQLGFLTPIQRAALAEEKLHTFFNSAFAARIFLSDQVMREIKFASYIETDQLYPDLPPCSEKIYVQGIADCAFIEKDGLVVVDYKTDREKREADLLTRYENQLRFYCKTLERIYHLPVKACYLYSFYLDKPLQFDFI